MSIPPAATHLCPRALPNVTISAKGNEITLIIKLTIMHIFFGIPALESWVMRQSGVVVCLRSAHLDCSHWATAVWYSCPDQQQQELAGQAVIIILQLWKRWLFLIESSGTYLAKTSLLLKLESRWRDLFRRKQDCLKWRSESV